MIITYYKMTGDELSRIFFEAKKKNKKLTKDMFADRIGVGRTKFFDFQKGVPIQEEEADAINKRITADPELNAARTLIKVGVDKSPDNLPQTQGATLADAGKTPSPDLWDKALTMLNDTLIMLKETIDTVRDDNKFIKEDAALYRDQVKDFKNGTLVYKPKR